MSAAAAHRFRSPGVFLAWLGLAALLGACTGATTSRQPTLPDFKDRITASDEPDATKRGRTRLELAAAYYGRGQTATALDQIKLSIQADPTSSEAYNLRGLIYASMGDPVLADESFRRALQLNPRDADAMQNFGWFLCQQKQHAEGDAWFERALASPNYRDTARTLLTQGVCQAQAGQLTLAEAKLNRSYELDPSNPATIINLSEVLYRRGEYERARFFIRRLNNQVDMSNAQTLWLASRIEKRLGNLQGAEDFGTQLSNRFPQSRESALFRQGAFDD
jgi:type IV pilus assembly protein PilF